MILLQIVMVSPGTHLVKGHESQSRTIEKKIFPPFGPMFGLRISPPGPSPGSTTAYHIRI